MCTVFDPQTTYPIPLLKLETQHGRMYTGRLKAYLLGPGWISRAVERMQRWLADGDQGVRETSREPRFLQ